jgi:hypothetical protein
MMEGSGHEGVNLVRIRVVRRACMGVVSVRRGRRGIAWLAWLEGIENRGRVEGHTIVQCIVLAVSVGWWGLRL